VTPSAGSDRLTRVLVIGTSLAWLIAWLFGYIQQASMLAGFIPGRFTVHPGGWPGVPAFLTPLSATLVHADLTHIGFNMLTLLFIGRLAENVLGWRLLGLLYLIGAYASAGGQFLAGPRSMDPMIGASGAISAVMGAYVMLFSRAEVKRIGPIPAHVVKGLWLAAAWISIQWLIGVAAGGSGLRVAIAAHIGGFLAGLLLARPLLAWRYRGA
jgi:membrane associated rhomboid family serine protease